MSPSVPIHEPHLLVIGLIYAAFASWVSRRAGSDRVVHIFTSILLVMVLWSLGLWLRFNTGDFQIYRVAILGYFAVISFLGPLMVHLVHALHAKRAGWRWALYGFQAYPIYLLLSGQVLTVAYPTNQLGPHYLEFHLILFAYVLWSVGYLLWGLRKTENPQLRLQSISLTLGIGLSALGGGLSNFVLPLVFTSFRASAWGPVFLLAFLAFAMLSIVQFKFLNTELFVKRSLLLTFCLGSVILVFFGLYNLLQRILATLIAANYIGLALVAILSVSFPLFYRWLNQWLDEVLFPHRAHNEQQLAEAQKLSNFGVQAAGMLHEFRHPLTKIMLGLDTLEDLSQGQPEQLKLIENLRHNIEQLRQQMDTALTPVRKAGDLAGAPIDLPELLAKTLFGLDKLAKTKGIQIDQKGWAGSYILPMAMNVFIQVLQNLVLNAIEAMPNGGTLGLEAWVTSDALCITIRDTGVGIGPSDLEMIFDAFYTTKESGTGLGLWLCRKIISDVSGSLQCHSVVGQGTVFEISVPLSAEPPITDYQLDLGALGAK